MAGQTVTFKIYRYDPDKDALPHYQDYELTLEPGVTLLNCINQIKWEQDQTLAYRYSCGSAICGSCAMRINGHATLVCKTQASDCVRNGVIQVDPIGNATVLRDLVVDLEPFWDSLGKIDPWLKPDTSAPEKERLQTAKQFSQIDPSTTCIMCASCWSDCNVLEVDKEFLGPATLAKAHRFIFDSRDARSGQRIDELQHETGFWDCTHCGECSTRCPTEAKPLHRIEEIRVKAMAEGHHKVSGARHVLAFRKTVGRTGLLDENLAPVISVGFDLPGLLSLAPVGLRMFMRGKNPPMIPHSIDKVSDIHKIYARYDSYRDEE